jgi:integrase
VFATEWAEAQDWKDTTREGFPMVLARLEATLPRDVTLREVDRLTIQRARVDLGRRYAPATVDLTMSYLMAVMRAAHHARRIGHDPTLGAQSRRRRSGDAEKVGPDDVPTRAEVAAIWQATPGPYRAAVALGATGLRVGEVLGLSVDRLDLDRRLVTVDRQLQRIAGTLRLVAPKGEKVRTVKVPGAVAVELRRHVRGHGGDLLFTGRRTGEPMRRDQFYASAWRPALTAAGLAGDRFKFHALRHFAASSMLAEGVNPMAVAGHLGDTLETLQRVYSHWMRDDRDVPADALERILVPEAAQLAASPRPGT